MSNGVGAEQPALRTGNAALSAATTPQTESVLSALLGKICRQNARLNELILIQRDCCVKVIGINPIEEPSPKEKEDPQGLAFEITRALEYKEELLDKLNCVTDQWMTL